MEAASVKVLEAEGQLLLPERPQNAISIPVDVYDDLPFVATSLVLRAKLPGVLAVKPGSSIYSNLLWI